MQAPNLDQQLRESGPYDPADMSLEAAREAARAWYVDQNGYASTPKLLTAPENQYKLGKSLRPAYGLTLAPASASGLNVCTWSTAACRAVCVLDTAGNARYQSVKDARVVKTRFLAAHPQAFVTLLHAELVKAVAKHGGIDFRPNVASDLRWEYIAPKLLELDGVRVYDYTKAPAAHRTPTDNYRLVFSVSEREASEREALEYLESGHNAAVVFATLKGHDLPATWNGFDVIDADTSDSRVDDPAGVVVGLRAKGAARGTDAGGFVKADVAS
jgi:hypothetical protein